MWPLSSDNDIAPDQIGYFAPALTSDLSQLPDTLLAVGALDLLVDETLQYALRLMRAGAPVETHVYPGAPHGFRSVPGELGERLASDISGALDRLFACGL
ncbi:MAG: alpha/beta hydrolase fold domain-containing protein [Devosia sp.]|nr:alpha/beta hydrolase fold domain-containing protein [Devosia sp.]